MTLSAVYFPEKSARTGSNHTELFTNRRNLKGHKNSFLAKNTWRFKIKAYLCAV